jgi:hypothetical protein
MGAKLGMILGIPMGISYGYQSKGVAPRAVHIVFILKGLFWEFDRAVQMVIKGKELGYAGDGTRGRCSGAISFSICSEMNSLQGSLTATWG